MNIKKLLKPLIIKTIPNHLIIWKGSSNNKSVALTFDDGPHPYFTEKILDILRDHQVNATFFLVGSNVEKHPNIAHRIRHEGHEIGNHSLTHNSYSRSKLRNVKTEIESTQKILKKTTGIGPVLFRPPYGIFSFDLIRYCVLERLTITMWSIDTRDFEINSTDELREKIFNTDIKSGDIILMHDNNDRTLHVLPDLIKHLKDQGYKFVTINNLLNSNFQETRNKRQ